jgi:hypothetical protein
LDKVQKEHKELFGKLRSNNRTLSREAAENMCKPMKDIDPDIYESTVKGMVDNIPDWVREND